MPRRTIRLKEHEPNLDGFKEIPERIVELSDDTLPEGPYRLRTDSDGFILSGNPTDTPGPDLFVLGGSFVESLCASESHRFTALVEKSLQGSSTPLRIRNAGYSGMTSLHMLGILTTKLPPLIHDDAKILLVVGQSDVNALSSPGLYWTQTKSVTPFGFPTADTYDLRQPWQDAFFQMVMTVVTFAKLRGYDFAITAGPYRNGDFDTDAVLRRTFRGNRDRFNRVMAMREFIVSNVSAIAAEHSIPLFDPSDHMLQRPDYFYDALHLNHAGQAAYAELLTSWISKAWLPAS